MSTTLHKVSLLEFPNIFIIQIAISANYFLLYQLIRKLDVQILFLHRFRDLNSSK